MRKQERIEFLETPTLKVLGPTLQEDQHGTTTYRLYHFCIHNPKPVNIENVQVELETIEPKVISFIPVPLQMSHRDVSDRSTDMNPEGKFDVDLVGMKTRGAHINIHHVIENRRQVDRHTTYLLTVKASGKQVPMPTRATFKVWVNENDQLECERISPIS